MLKARMSDLAMETLSSSGSTRHSSARKTLSWVAANLLKSSYDKSTLVSKVGDLIQVPDPQPFRVGFPWTAQGSTLEPRLLSVHRSIRNQECLMTLCSGDLKLQAGQFRSEASLPERPNSQAWAQVCCSGRFWGVSNSGLGFGHEVWGSGYKTCAPGTCQLAATSAARYSKYF